MPLKASGKTVETGHALRLRIKKTISAEGQLELATSPAARDRQENQGRLDFVDAISDGDIGWTDPALMESGRA